MGVAVEQHGAVGFNRELLGNAEFQLVVCRTVLNSFCESLRSFGQVTSSPAAARFAPLAPRERILREAA